METLLRFIPVSMDLLTRAKEPKRNVEKANVAARPPAEKAAEPKVETVLVKAPAPSVKSAFHRQEEKAAQLGAKMAQQGFGYMDNPYAGLNKRLEGVWSSGFGKYFAAVNKVEQPIDLKTQKGVVEIRRIQAA